MAKAPGISEAEWDVMKVVWDHEPIAASDVADKLAAEREWHPQTVKTMLTRLVGKGVANLAPVASNQSDEGRAKNRRVELVLQ